MTAMDRPDRESRRLWGQAHPLRAGLRAGGFVAAGFAVVWPILVGTSITAGIVTGLVSGLIVGASVAFGLKRGYLPVATRNLVHSPAAIGNPDRPGSLARFFTRRPRHVALVQLLRGLDGQSVELHCTFPTFDARSIRPFRGPLDASDLGRGAVSIGYPGEEPRVVPVSDIRWVVTDAGAHGPF
jgi:hypothetical protein